MLGAYRDVEWTPDSTALLIAASAPETRLWLIPADGHVPRKLDVDTSHWVTAHGFRLHPGGRQIAFFSGEDAREVWVFENVVPMATK